MRTKEHLVNNVKHDFSPAREAVLIAAAPAAK
jgi:hypothetical protein